MSGTVLLIEDEESIASVVRAYLERDGYKVAWARSGADGLAELSRHAVRLVVLDIGLPDINGFEVCRQIRSRSTVPILMLTARDDEIDRVTGLEVGADDYVSKPFSPRELVARIKAILRRTDGEGSQERLVLGDIELNGPAREVRVAGHSVDLRAKEFDLLAFLMENRGIVVSRDTLLDRVWGMEYAGGSRTVDVHVAQLRSKLGRPNLIRTIRGAGYKAVNP
ncbi:MAG TPA: response regulator transcription factor [Gaiellaceae bacterium]|nr:response regulator transcription factor [Gaiellaceae bacterium]